MSDEELLRDCTRFREAEGTFTLEVMAIRWEGPHAPTADWKPLRTWKRRPTPDRISSAQRAAIETSRFFGRCSRCGELNLAGRMHDARICQGCAERYLGIVY